jgi:hypothetical protein
MPTKITKVKISKKFGKNKRKSLKIQKGGEIDEKLKFLLDFFNVIDANREYLVNAWSDAIELYSVVNWNASDQDKILFVENINQPNNSNGAALSNGNVSNASAHPPVKLQIGQNNEHYRRNPKVYKINSNNAKNSVTYSISSIVKTKRKSTTPKSYSMIAKIRYEKPDNKIYIQIPEFSITLLKNELDEYIILANYESFFNPYSYYFSQLIAILYEYLKKKIVDSASKPRDDIKILFFGHSMGAIIVQHLYLYFHRNIEFNNANLYMISSSTGNTLKEEDNTYYNEYINGNFISYGFCTIHPFGNFQEQYQNYKIDQEEPVIEMKDIMDKLIIDSHLFNFKNQIGNKVLLTMKTILLQIKLRQNEIIAVTDLSKFQYFKDNIEDYLIKFPDLFFNMIHDFSSSRHALLSLIHT